MRKNYTTPQIESLEMIQDGILCSSDAETLTEMFIEDSYNGLWE